MKLTLVHWNKVFLAATSGLLVFCLIELMLLGKIYPYAFLGTMSLLAASSFLALTTFKNRFQPRTVSLLFILAVANFLLLLSFSFYPFLLRNLWNISFGIVFIFPAAFIIQFVKEKTKKIDQVVFYLTLMTTILFEIVLLLKLPYSFIYNVLTACFLLLSILLLTTFIFKLKR